MAKPKNLRDINIREVSLVDLPANKQSFVFFKRQDGAGKTQFTKAKKKITIEIESDGTVKATKITINGDELGKLKSFEFGFYNDDPKATIHASYTKTTESVDGFSRTETFYLTKGMIMDKKTLKALQKYLGTEDIDFEKKVDEEEIQKAITLISEHYQDSFPEDLVNAVGVIAKRAANSYAVEDVEKTGAKFSKDVLKKLKAVLAAVEALKSILPADTATEKNKTSEETDELAKQVKELTETVAKLDPDKKENKGKSDVTELTKTLKDVSERLKTMEKDGATKKSITDQEENDNDAPKGAGKDGKILWKSFQAHIED